MGNHKLTDKEIENDKTNSIMNTIAERAGYYRCNLDKFCYDYLGIKNLKWFQKILLWMMNKYDNFLLLACRGIGKTYICSLFATCRCILYPGEICLSVSSTYKQAVNLIKKVTEDFMQKSPMLCNEIEKWSTGQNDCYILFKNGSILRAITSTESSRGHRSHILLIDESRLVPQNIVSTILRPMNATPRQPGYLSKPEYAHLAEMPKEIYLTSAFYAMSELYEQAKSYFANMFDPTLSFGIVDLPYQVSIKEGLLMKQQIINEKSDQTFSDIAFMMEREGLFYGMVDDAFFNFNILEKQRILTDALYDLDYYKLNNVKIPEKTLGEIRVLSVDIALMASKRHRNDASAIMIHSAIPTKDNDYIDNIILVDTKEGLITEDLGLLIMRYYYQYDCDYIALDATGVGQPIFDYLVGGDRYDPLYNETYSCLNVVNNSDLEDRCKVSTAPKVIYAIKANSRSNNDMALSLRAGFQNGYINLLVRENFVEEKLYKMRGYKNLSELQQTKLKIPYIQTTYLIDELVNLTYETSNNLIKLKERPNMRKDRVSSCMYGWYVIQELRKDLKPKTSTSDLLSKLSSHIKPARY